MKKIILYVVICMLFVSFASAYTIVGLPDTYSTSSADYLFAMDFEDGVANATAGCSIEAGVVANGTKSLKCTKQDFGYFGAGRLTAPTNNMTCEFFVRHNSAANWIGWTMGQNCVAGSVERKIMGYYAMPTLYNTYYNGSAYVNHTPGAVVNANTWYHQKIQIGKQDAFHVEFNGSLNYVDGNAWGNSSDNVSIENLNCFGGGDNDGGENIYFDTVVCYEGFTAPVLRQTLNISNNFPDNAQLFGGVNNKTINFNATVASSYNNYTLRLIVGGSTLQEINYTAGQSAVSMTETLSVGTYNWYFQVQNNETTVDTVSRSLEVRNIGIDNCSTYGTVAMNISLFNETNESSLIGSLAGYLKLWLDDEDTFVPFNLTWNDGRTFGICIDGNLSYNAYAQFEYSSGDLPEETYYLYNTTLSNNTKSLKFYLTDQTERVTFTVTDTNDNPIQDVYINVLQYDLETNSYHTTEILKSDSNGQAIGNIILNTQWYQFILNYQGVIVQETTPTKITSTSKQFRVNLDADYFGNYDIAHGIITSLTYTNATKNFALTWDDPSGNMHLMCMEVIKRTINGDIKLNQTCVESTSGTTLINIGTPIDETYIATAWIAFDQPFIMDVLSVSYNDTWKTFGTAGVFVSFLLIVAVTMVGLWNPIAAVIMMIAGFIFTNLIGIFHLDWEWLISLIILGGIVAYRLGRKE